MKHSIEPNRHIVFLDGLRGLAIILVLGYHFFKIFPFGWMGVDLFFVLSGFLITSKLVADNISFKKLLLFWLKRILRIMPLYYLLLFITFIAVPLLVPSVNDSLIFKNLLHTQVYYWTFSINWIDASNGWPQHYMFIHIWSLCVEMQFYFIFPLLLACTRPRYLFNKSIVLALIIAVVLFRMYGSNFFAFNPIYRYVLMFSRFDGLLLGGFIYYAWSNNKLPKMAPVIIALAIGSLATIVGWVMVTCNVWTSELGFVSEYGYTLNSLLFSGLLCWLLMQPASIIATIFSNKWLVSMGTYSFCIYLIHVPLYIVIDKLYMHYNTPIAFILYLLLYVCAAYALGWISYNTIEKWASKIKVKFNR